MRDRNDVDSISFPHKIHRVLVAFYDVSGTKVVIPCSKVNPLRLSFAEHDRRWRSGLSRLWERLQNRTGKEMKPDV